MIPLTDNRTGQRSFTGHSKNLLVQPNNQVNHQRIFIGYSKRRCTIICIKKELDKMGHLHLLLDEMGLDEMGLDEMGINPTKVYSKRSINGRGATNVGGASLVNSVHKLLLGTMYNYRADRRTDINKPWLHSSFSDRAWTCNFPYFNKVRKGPINFSAYVFADTGLSVEYFTYLKCLTVLCKVLKALLMLVASNSGQC